MVLFPREKRGNAAGSPAAQESGIANEKKPDKSAIEIKNEHEEDWHGWLREIDSTDLVWAAKADCSGDPYSKDCKECLKSKGVKHRHMKGSMRAAWTMTADLSGPHPVAIGTNYVYMMAVVFTGGDGVHLPFVKGLEGKKAEGVEVQLQEAMNEARAMYGVSTLTRLHSDLGGEFWNANFFRCRTSFKPQLEEITLRVMD